MLENPNESDALTRYAEPVGVRVRELFPALHDELRRLARAHLNRERPDHTLGATELVHEMYLRLDDATRQTFRGRTHFLATVSIMMRHALVDHARRRGAAKRGGGGARIDLDERLAWTEDNIRQVLAVDWVLSELDGLDPRLSALAQMRCFGGMSDGDFADEMGYSDRWVRKQWAFTRAWVLRRTADLAAESGDGELFPLPD